MQSIRNNSLEPISISNWRWAYFLDETIKAFSTFQTRPYPIDNDFLFRESFFGSSSNPKKVILETWGLKMEKIRQARCACLQAGEITSVMNLVISPFNNYDLPFFGADFVTLPNGQTKSYKATNSGIIELNSSGEEISEFFIIEDD